MTITATELTRAIEKSPAMSHQEKKVIKLAAMTAGTEYPDTVSASL